MSSVSFPVLRAELAKATYFMSYRVISNETMAVWVGVSQCHPLLQLCCGVSPEVSFTFRLSLVRDTRAR